MIKVKILKDGVRGADDGATVLPYPKDGGPNGDGVYVVSDALAEVFIEAHEAEEIEEKKPTATDRVKAKKSSDKAAADKAEADRIAAEKAVADKAEADRIAAEKAETDRLAAEQAEADRLAAEKAAADKAEADRIAAEKAAGNGLPGLPGLPKAPGK